MALAEAELPINGARMSISLKPLNQQAIVITGASSGIGLATALSAAQQGAQLVLRDEASHSRHLGRCIVSALVGAVLATASMTVPAQQGDGTDVADPDPRLQARQGRGDARAHRDAEGAAGLHGHGVRAAA